MRKMINNKYNTSLNGWVHTSVAKECHIDIVSSGEEPESVGK